MTDQGHHHAAVSSLARVHDVLLAPVIMIRLQTSHLARHDAAARLVGRQQQLPQPAPRPRACRCSSEATVHPTLCKVRGLQVPTATASRAFKFKFKAAGATKKNQKERRERIGEGQPQSLLTQQPDVIGDLHEGHCGAVERAAGLHDGVVCCQRLELVGRRNERISCGCREF